MRCVCWVITESFASVSLRGCLADAPPTLQGTPRALSTAMTGCEESLRVVEPVSTATKSGALESHCPLAVWVAIIAVVADIVEVGRCEKIDDVVVLRRKFV